MATSIIPKSTVRKEGAEHIIMGFAELPTIETPEGTCWVLPGSEVICDPTLAKERAERLDTVIRDNIEKTGRTLLH